MRRVLSLLLAFLLVLGALSVSALAEGDEDLLPPISGGGVGLPPMATQPEETPESYEGYEVYYATPDGFDGFFDMQLGDSAFDQLHSYLDSAVIYATAQKEENTKSLKLSILWDFSTVDAATPGKYFAVGTIALPEGAVWAEGMANTITIAVRVISLSNALPQAIVLTGFDDLPSAGAVAIEQNNESGLEHWFSSERMAVTGHDAQGNTYTLYADQWDLSAVDLAVTGVYAATVRPKLERGYALADGVTLPTLTSWVSVQKAGKPEIDCCTAARNIFWFPWVLTDTQKTQLDKFSVWLRPHGGSWARLTGTTVQLTVSELQLSAGALTQGESYELQVDYPGGQTGILSFDYDKALLISDYTQGSRDGGGDGIELPDVIQPSPVLPTEPVYTPAPLPVPSAGQAETKPAEVQEAPPTKAPVHAVKPAQPSRQEIETADSATFSGTRILALVELGEPLTIQKEGSIVTISVSALRELGLSAEQSLSLTLTRPSSSTVCLTMMVDGAALEYIADVRLQVQYTSKNAILWILDEAGTKLTQADYSDGALSFTVHCGGTYTISEEAAEIPPVSESSSAKPAEHTWSVKQPIIIVLVCGSAFLLAAAALAWHRRSMR